MAELRGLLKWSGERDPEGHRNYRAEWQVECEPTEGPASALSCPGLPEIGSEWAIDDDEDLWAWCRADAGVEPYVDQEKNTFFKVTQLFSTKPPPVGQRRCMNLPIEDPLLEPQKLRGGLTRYTDNPAFDRFGLRIVNSSHEQIEGPQNEWDANRNTVSIEQNVANLELPLMSAMRDAVNRDALWGHAPRTIKLTNFTWERKWHGVCELYFTRVFEFEIRDEGWDRNIADEGTKVLHGHWGTVAGTGVPDAWILDNLDGAPPNPDNPQHFDRFKDRNGENTTTLLDGHGKPASASRGILIKSMATIPQPGDEPSDLLFETDQAHGFVVNDTVNVVGVNKPFLNNKYTVISIFNATHFVVAGPIDGIEPEDFISGGYVYKSGVSMPGIIHVERYIEADFLLLGIPTDLESSI